jgi:phosphodiesterase/alkaline phosphatase D-like protein
VSISNFLELTLLDLTFNATAYAGQSTVYCKLHTGDPGEDCTSNAATETTRKSFTVGAAASGAVTTDSAMTWTNVAATETYSHVSIWDAVAAGNPLWYGAMSASKSVTAGDTFTFAIGQTISLD